MTRWHVALLFAVLGVLCGLALWRWGPFDEEDRQRFATAAGVAVAGLGLGAAPARRRVSRMVIEREIAAAQQEEQLHRTAAHVVAQERIAENHARMAAEARARRFDAQARLREIEPKIEAEIGRRGR